MRWSPGGSSDDVEDRRLQPHLLDGLLRLGRHREVQLLPPRRGERVPRESFDGGREERERERAVGVLERELDRHLGALVVREDVRGGLVSIEAAARDYGVVLSGADLEVDAAATQAARASRPNAGMFHRKTYSETLA